MAADTQQRKHQGHMTLCKTAGQISVEQLNSRLFFELKDLRITLVAMFAHLYVEGGLKQKFTRVY